MAIIEETSRTASFAEGVDASSVKGAKIGEHLHDDHDQPHKLIKFSRLLPHRHIVHHKFLGIDLLVSF